MNIHSQIPPVTRCGSFHPGHEVHWIQALGAEGDPETGEGSALVDSEGWITISLDNGRTERRWTHEPTRLAKALEACGSRVVLRTRSVLGVPSEDGMYTFSVDHRPSSCPSADEDQDEESLEEQLTKRGGFTISGDELARRGLIPVD
jgi:hypothetical protein